MRDGKDTKISIPIQKLKKRLRCAVWIVLWLCIVSANLAATSSPAGAAEASQPADAKEPSKFYSAEDGWLDVSGFLDEKYGFLPVVVPITEPAVG